MKRIYEDVRYSMEFTIGHQHLLDERCFRLTVMEDKSQFDEADTSDISQHFQDWATNALNEEQGSNEEIESRRQELIPWYGSLAVRYRFCLQIDAAALQSILKRKRGAWVNLIRDDWQVTQAMAKGPSGDWDQDDCTDLEEEFPPIEGNTREDVGWMKVDYKCLMPTCYSHLCDPDFWASNYAGPPHVLSSSDLDSDRWF
jgi:hypothetical protein